MQVNNPQHNLSTQIDLKKPRFKGAERRQTGKLDTHQGVATDLTKDPQAQLRQLAVKRGKLVHIGGEQRIQIGNDWFRPYVGRKGYDENFLGEKLEMPKLGDSIKDKAARRVDDPSKTELEYTNFSIVQNAERRMPFFTAVNIDGAQIKEVERDGKWLFDARIDRDAQMGNEAYKKNDWDRGHMVRRRDSTWGSKAEQGSKDTFVYTNAALQHKELNQHEWLDLEDRLLDKAEAQDSKMTVFTGPVFRDDDPKFNNNGKMNYDAQIPQEFWKVAVWNDKEKGLQSEAFVMSQRHDIAGNSGPEKDLTKESQFAVYRVPLHQVEELTNLDFGKLDNNCTQCQHIDKNKPLQEQLA